jgi:hypothetical protein
MPATVTLSELRQRARDLADMQTSNQAQAFVTDAELDRTLNRALKQLYQKLIIARGDEYYAKSTTFPTVANQATYSVPSDFMALLTLNVTDGTRVIFTPKFNFKQWHELKYLENLSSNDLSFYRYRLVGPNIEIRPAPKLTTHTFTLYYLPAFTPLVNAADTFDGVNGWEDWACYTAAIDMLTKEESLEQAQLLAGQRNELDAQIAALAGNRDAGLPEVVGDSMLDWTTYSARRLRNDWNW